MKPSLLVFDFDETIAQTFQKSPGGIGVREAYSLAIGDVFGEKALSDHEFKNQTPTEIVNSILSSTGSHQYIDQAKVFFESNLSRLQAQVPPGKGFPLVWSDDHPEQIATELVVRQKLAYLLSQVGSRFADETIWPMPTPGFIELWRNINFNEEFSSVVKTAVISSGHDLFIRNFFDLWSLPEPNILVTEDDVRGRKYPKELDRRAKPGLLQFALVHQQWMALEGMGNFNLQEASEARSRMIYFGDDLRKDGLLAEGARVPFGWFNRHGIKADIHIKNSFQISSWSGTENQLPFRAPLPRQ